MTDDLDMPHGIRMLYDLFVKASEFPGESAPNKRNLYSWAQKLKALHQILSAYHDDAYRAEYDDVMKRMQKISALYPSEEYTAQGYELLYDWLGCISRLYQRLGLMIPENIGK